MPRRCVAANCSNEPSEQVSLFKFPKDEKLSREWSRQVQRTRADWRTPTANSVVCSDHFENDCFDQVVNIKESLGFPQRLRRRLLPGAIPTIFRRKRQGDSEESGQKRTSHAAAKLSRKRVTTEILMAVRKEQNGRQDPGPQEDIEISPPETYSRPNDMSSQTDFPTPEPTKPKTRNVAMLAKWKGYSKRTQTESASAPTKQFMSVETQTIDESPAYSQPQHEEGSSLESNSCTDHEEESVAHSEYKASESSDTDTDNSCPEDEPEMFNTQAHGTDTSIHKERKYIIFISALFRLLTWCTCPSCGHKDLKCSQREIGTMLILTLFCTACGKTTPWHSQPYIGNIPAGNILLSAAILFAGATVTKVLRVLSHMGLATISQRTYFRHQSEILLKTIRKCWKDHQDWLLAAFQGSENRLICGGDGRADSPGHCAKYGTYTLIELQERVILDLQLVQSNECGGSYHMEKEGLIRSLGALENHDLQVDVLITDRHRQIAKFLREEHPEVLHLYDVWHVAKGIKTKLRALGRKAACKTIVPWISSIVNHLYWSASSTPEGQGEMMEAKWKSVVDHIQNQHNRFEGVFTECRHGPLEGREARKKWIGATTTAGIEVEKLVTNGYLCRDIRQLSGHYQTSMLEAFHSLLIHFAPKMLVFTYEGILCRVILAALHFNENSRRKQKKTVDGNLQYSLHYPKFKQGGFVVKKMLEDPTYGYVDDLMTDMIVSLQRGQADDVPSLEVPPPLNETFFKPSKEDAVQAHVTRFNLN